VSTTTKTDAGTSALSVETNGINTITEAERKGKPRDLFWPWAAANLSLFGVAYGAYLLGFGVSFWQATFIGIVGIIVSFLFVGIIALAGKRGSAPTLVLSRSIFGVNGNKVPSILSWVLTVGWEIVLVSLATLATATVITQMGGDGGVLTKVIALIIVAALVVAAGVIGFDLILKLQFWITIATAVLTVVYIVIAIPHIDLAVIAAIPAGDLPAVIGGFVFMMTGFGLGWVNAAADYSRYLPRNASSKGVVGWTTFGASVAPVLLLIFGLLLAGSSEDLMNALFIDPVGALAPILPTWFLVPFILVAVLGFVGGAVLDIYSSGLALLTAGIRIPRPVAAGIDGVLMILGAIYVVFVATDFIGPFQAFLVTVGAPIAVWAGIFLADTILRKKGYAEKELYTAKGRYGSVSWLPIALMIVGTAVGWGFVTNTYFAAGFDWLGYFMGAIGGKEGTWQFANLGVLFALLIGFLGYLIFGRAAVKKQESTPLDND
jgi:purine-cytosine permease-like protein